MLIEKIVLNNFRIYQNTNELNLSNDSNLNVSIVAGNNGFGKTSLLTSLVWCLYGKLMSDVDDRYRREILESGGYKRYCEKIMNRVAVSNNEKKIEELQKDFEKANVVEKRKIKQDIEKLNSFSVSIQFTKLFIPSIPCEYLEITRTYNISNHEETTELLIDGQLNELTKTVGSEIFINDFILPKEVAKFFFFDAERIVSLAEIRTIEDKRNLSLAYAEVLGIKKYLDLKDGLENVRLRLRKKTSDLEDRQRLIRLKKQVDQNEKLIAHSEQMIKGKAEELAMKRLSSDKYQEQLIREGTSITLEELKEFKQMKDVLQEESNKIKNRLKDMMELAPFAIAANRLNQVKLQLEGEQEQDNKAVSEAFLKVKITAIKKALKTNQNILSLGLKKEEQIIEIVKQTLLTGEVNDVKPLLNYSKEKQIQFATIYDDLHDSYSQKIRNLIADYKKQQATNNIISRKLQNAESKEKDPVIKTIRNDKTQLDSQIKNLEIDLVELKAKKISLQNETANFSKQLSELTKNVRVEDIDKAKDETAERLIKELEEFIHKLKLKKKASLEKNIHNELNRLMHKKDFVKKAEVIIEGDLIDIELYDSGNRLINKEGLSKGEQQLYATALLKALVNESNIKFPVFIDSPLQKFDKEHAKNIIADFYPNVSGQVVLFPLLEKELNEEEYQLLLPRTGNAYLIENVEQYCSQFIKIKPKDLFKIYRKDYVN